MQVNTIDMVSLTKSKASSKSSKKDEFGDALKDAEKKGDTDLAQIMAAYGYMVSPRHRQPDQDNAQNAAQGSAENGAVGAVQTLGGGSNTTIDLVAMLQMKTKGLLITQQATQQETAKVDALMAATAPIAEKMQKAQENNSVFPALATGDASAKSAGNIQLAKAAQTVPDVDTEQTQQTTQNQQTPQTTQTAQTAQATQMARFVQSMIETPNLKVVSTPPSDQPTNTVQTAKADGNIQTPQAQTAATNSFSAQLDTATASVTAAQNGQAAAQVIPAQQDTVKVNGTATDVKPLKSADAVTEVSPVSQTQAQIAGVKHASESAGSESGDSKSDDGAKDKGDTSAAQSVLGAAHMNNIDTKGVESAPKEAKTDVASQVTDAVKQAVDNGRTEVKLHLSPEELGGISIRIVSQNGALTVQIAADNQHTGQLLASSMHELSQSMQSQGITMDKAEVTYAGTGGVDAATSQGQQQNQQSANQTMPKWVPAMETAKTAAVSATSGVSASPSIYTKNAGMSILV